MTSLHPALINRLRQIYLEGDTAAYQAACQRSFELPDELVQVLEVAEFWLEPDSPIKADIWPSVNFLIVAPSFIEGLFHAEYRIRLDISKLFPAYRLSFDYEVINQDPDALQPSFMGFGEEPLTKSQYNFLEAWEKTAQSLGWVRLSESQGQHPLSQVLDTPTAFPSESLWRHLSFDLLELCPN